MHHGADGVVDMGSSVSVMYHDTFMKLRLSENQLRPVKTPLADFNGDTVDIEGLITLPVELGVEPIVKRVIMVFVVANSLVPIT